MNTAAICTIGDEILIGQIVDTNTSFIARLLNQKGIKVEKNISIKDDKKEIINELSSLCEQFDIVIATGGLGPTKDDITKQALFELSESDKYIEDQRQLLIISGIAKKRGLSLLEINKLQASVPNKCRVMVNIMGTAPGMFFKINRKRSNGEALLFSLPGVPYEMEYLSKEMINLIESQLKLEIIYHKTLTTFGLPESVLSNTIESWELSLPKCVKLAYLPNPLTGIRLRLSIYGGDSLTNEKILDKEISKLRTILGNVIYGTELDTLESSLFKLLKERNRSISVAESCTGGKISSMLTSIPGISQVFKGGVIAYNNSVKADILGVDPNILLKFGAVSVECASAMAQGVKRVTGSDFGLAVTGIAGPDGGTDLKPVGTVCIAACDGINVITHTIITTSDRKRNIERSSAEALNFLRIQLLENKIK